MQNSITWREIHGQPALWGAVFHAVRAQRGKVEELFRSFASCREREAVLTGAGSSAFVGEAAAPFFQSLTGWRARAMPTTDLVTHPSLHPSAATLLISFARSGNSPESLAAVDLVDQMGHDVHHLIITCNARGALASVPETTRRKILLLPEEANDQGLAMIGSVTGMLLAARLVAELPRLDSLAGTVAQLSAAGAHFLHAYEQPLADLAARLRMDRIVCLGSGALLGVAREAHLKVQELSDGQVIGKFDSFLGFRHGPKAVLNPATAVLYFLSNDAYVARYEKDLVDSIARDGYAEFTCGISSSPSSLPLGLSAHAGDLLRGLDDSWCGIPFLLPAQLLAVHKSARCGLDPDSPSARGAIHRVVQGVTIYPYGGRP